jgi:hypothetical protein
VSRAFPHARARVSLIACTDRLSDRFRRAIPGSSSDCTLSKLQQRETQTATGSMDRRATRLPGFNSFAWSATDMTCAREALHLTLRDARLRRSCLGRSSSFGFADAREVMIALHVFRRDARSHRTFATIVVSSPRSLIGRCTWLYPRAIRSWVLRRPSCAAACDRLDHPWPLARSRVSSSGVAVPSACFRGRCLADPMVRTPVDQRPV